jgi:uncharacterized lipoprotein YmbA
MSIAFGRFTLAGLACVAAACTSVPIHYYTLIPPPDRSLPESPAAFSIEVRVVHIPTELNRSELTVRTGPTQTVVLENERWASPMKGEIQDAVRLELERRLGRMSGVPPAIDQLAIDIDIQRLEAELGRYALIEASWRVTSSRAARPPSGAALTACRFRREATIHGGYAAMVEGYQQDIAGLADAVANAVAAALTSSAGGVDVPCNRVGSTPPMEG